MDQLKKNYGIPKNVFSYKTNNNKLRENASEDFWKDCENEKLDNKQLSTMQDSNRENSSIFSSLRSNKNSGRNLSQPTKTESIKRTTKLSSNNEIVKEANKNIEKMYSQLINNLNKDVMCFRNIRKDVKKEKSNEKYHSTGSSADSVITFTEKKSKRVNRSMDNKQERTLNNSLFELREDTENNKFIRNDKVNKIYNNLYLGFMKKKEKLNMKVQEYQKMKSEKEKEDCTFKPKINNYKHLKKKSLNVDMYERTKKWKETNAEKLEKTKQQTNTQKFTECSFKPVINKAISTNTESEAIRDKDTQKYFKRLNDAKKTKEEKFAKLYPDVNIIYDKLFKKNRGNALNMTSDNPINTDYCTFNPYKNKNDYLNIRMKLKQELNSIILTKNDEND